jgi:hypothetical protein
MVGALLPRQAITWVVDALVVGAFMAAVGVRASLASPTATRAMAVTIGAWLCAYVVIWTTAGMLLLVGLLVYNAAWLVASQFGVALPIAAFTAPVPGYIAWPATVNGLYLIATFLVFSDTSLRFDRIAGRMTQGGASLAFDEFLYGRPEEPVLLNAEAESDNPPAEPRAENGDWPEPAAAQSRGDAVAPSA